MHAEPLAKTQMTKFNLGIRLAYYVLFSILVMILLMFAAELFLRVTGKYPISAFVYDKQLIWRLKPNHHETRGDKKISFNEDGFRDRNHPLEKPANTKRVIILGDSYTFGGIDYSDEQIFTSQLEKKLNENKSGQLSYEVMNVSAPSWATDQQLNYLRQEGINHQPDYVILMVSPNDIRETYGKKVYQLTENNQLKENVVWMPPKPRIGWFLASHSSLFQLLQAKVLHKDYGTFFNIYRYYPVNFGVEDSTDWDRPLFLKKKIKQVEDAKLLFSLLFSEMANICNQHHCKLMVAIIPTKAEFSNTNEDYQPGLMASYLDSVTSEKNISYLNLFDKAKVLTDPLSLYMSWEYHFNETGHNFTADNLYLFFKDNE